MTTNSHNCGSTRRGPALLAALAAAALAVPGVAHAGLGNGDGNGNGNGAGSVNAGGNNPNAGGANAGGNGNGNGHAGGNAQPTPAPSASPPPSTPTSAVPNPAPSQSPAASPNGSGAAPATPSLGNATDNSTSPDPASPNDSGDTASAPPDSNASPAPSPAPVTSQPATDGAALQRPSESPVSSSAADEGPPAHESHPSSHSVPSGSSNVVRRPQSAPVPAPVYVAAVVPPAQTVSDYGVAGRSARLTLVRGGINGQPAIRVAFARHGSEFSFDAIGAVRADRVGLSYRIGAWLRSSALGVTVCLRIKEISPKDPLTSVRTTETCFSPTTEWRHFRIVRRTIARGDKLVFSAYSYGATSGDKFDIDGFVVMRNTADGWKRVDSAFGNRSPVSGS